MTNDEMARSILPHSDFVINSSFVIRISSFEQSHSGESSNGRLLPHYRHHNFPAVRSAPMLEKEDTLPRA